MSWVSKLPSWVLFGLVGMSHSGEVDDDLRDRFRSFTTQQAPLLGGAFSAYANSVHETKHWSKWTQYFPAYHRHLRQFIGKEVHILEIGVAKGGSIDMWNAVFGERAHVYGLDWERRDLHFHSNKTKVFSGDQAHFSTWDAIKRHIPRLDIVIDDGAHELRPTIVALMELVPWLNAGRHVGPQMRRPGWVYMIEDLHGHDHAFWAAFASVFPLVQSTVTSVHHYPWLLVLENAEPINTLRRQFDVHPLHIVMQHGRFEFATNKSKRVSEIMDTDLRTIRHFLHNVRHEGLTTEVIDARMPLSTIVTPKKGEKGGLLLTSRAAGTPLTRWGSKNNRLVWTVLDMAKDLHSLAPICYDRLNWYARSCPLSAFQTQFLCVSLYPQFVILQYQAEQDDPEFVPVSIIERGSRM